jgi:multidrug efflux pump subunit AcrA (membrane-fusion protein)
MKKRCMVLAGILLLTGTGGVALAVSHPGALATVGPRALRSRVVARAVVTATDGTAEVRARTSGRVTRVDVQAGERVREGQLLAVLEAANLERSLDAARAELRALEAQARSTDEGVRAEERDAIAAEASAARSELALALDREGRESRLLTADVSTDRSVNEYHHAAAAARARLAAAEARERLALAGGRAADRDAATARVEQARARVDELATELSWTRIVAPRAGVVLARSLSPGDEVFPGAAALFEIADPSRIEVRIEVEERDALSVALGSDVTLVPRGGGKSLGAGKVSRLGARLERRTIGAEESRVRADANVRAAWVAWEGGDPLPLGLRLEAVVEGPSRTVEASLPRAAVRFREGQALVRERVGPWFREAPVELGLADDEAVEVRGLAPGAVVLAGR